MRSASLRRLFRGRGTFARSRIVWRAGRAAFPPPPVTPGAARLPRPPIRFDQPPFVTIVFHAPFFTWYSVDIPLFSEPSFANEIRPVMPSKSIFFSAGR